MSTRGLSLLALLGILGCVGAIGESEGTAEPPAVVDPNDLVPEGVDPLTDPAGLGESGIRRLSRNEYRQVVLDLTGVDIGADVELLPADETTPFDNDYTTQTPSRSLVDAARVLASRVADQVVGDMELRNAILPCNPSGASDEACLREFIASFGRTALRRPLEPSELDEYGTFLSFAADADDFDVAVNMVLRAFLQDVEMLYRVELGEPVADRAGVFRLNEWELATRLSFLIWGSTPDDALLDAAASGELNTEAGLQRVAHRMLADERAIARIQAFHAMWLGYNDIPLPDDLAVPLRDETDRLVARVVEEQRSWLELFTFPETFVNETLANHYGLDVPEGGEGWAEYTDGRAGLLSHGSFLSGGAKFGDTSPVRRGIAIRERLLCQEIPPPDPSLVVDVDEPPGDPNACKKERYAMHAVGGCAGCHSLTDPIGFGLENFGPAGEYRAHDVNRPECPIDGDGAVAGIGPFNGPGELGALLAGSGELEACAVEQLHHFVVGREAGAGDDRTVSSLLEHFRDGHRFDLLLEAVVMSEAFRHRVEAN